VASFYAATMAALDELGVAVRLFARPSEVVDAIPFDQDELHRTYDADAAHRFWLLLVQAHRVMVQFRAGFIGKASPVHFFWGGADLATTRFSGRRAPKHPGGVPNCPDWVQELAYSHEVSSCGYWPSGSDEGSFYAYAYPQPDGFPRLACRTGWRLLRRQARRVPAALCRGANRAGPGRGAVVVLPNQLRSRRRARRLGPRVARGGTLFLPPMSAGPASALDEAQARSPADRLLRSRRGHGPPG
jgi:hypothetical protein